MSRAQYDDMLALLESLGERLARAEERLGRLERESQGAANGAAQAKDGAS